MPSSSTEPRPATQAGASTSNPVVPNGTVQGRLVRHAGVDPRSGSAGSADVPVPGVPLRAVDGSGTTRGTAVSTPAGTFTIQLPAGRFTIIEDACNTSQFVVVTGGETAVITLVIPNAC